MKARLSLVFLGSSQHFKKYRFTKHTTLPTCKNGIIKLGRLRLQFISSSTIWVHKRLLLWELIVEAMLK
jgi:hypothetical protein